MYTNKHQKGEINQLLIFFSFTAVILPVLDSVSFARSYKFINQIIKYVECICI